MRSAVTLLLTFSSAFILASCGDGSAAKQAVLAVLKDPDSAKFDDITVIGSRACLTVNAKNSMGGYVGRKQFEVHADSSRNWHVVSSEEELHSDCVGRITKAADADQRLAESSKRICDGIQDTINDPKYSAELKAKAKAFQSQHSCR